MAAADKLTQLFAQAATSNDFAITCLQLCEVGYLSPAEIPAAVVKMKPLTSGGQWQCPWAAQDADQSNLAFVALYYANPATAPELAVVMIRGTDFDITDAWGKIEQLWEDLDCTNQAPLPWAPDDPAQVAQGTLDGLEAILGLTSGLQSLEAYLQTLVNEPANADLALVVTGHSLGGCLTTVFAPGLRDRLKPRIVPIMPVTFAAPTAGNRDFAAYFEREFPQALRYANSLDAIPKAWADLSGLDTIYEPCGMTVPDIVYVGALGFELAMYLTGVDYLQPAATTLPGSCSRTAANWYDEGLYQHHPATYMRLLGGTDVASVPPLVTTSTKPTIARLHAKLGPLSAVVETAKTAAASA
jgi:triacylglycerol lipase